MNYDAKQTEAWQKADKALKNLEKEKAAHAEKEKKLRKNIDDLSEQVADSRVSYELGEIKDKQLQDMIKKAEKAHEKLLQHQQRSEPLRMAKEKLQERRQEIFEKKVESLTPKAQQHYAKLLDDFLIQANKLKSATAAANDFAAASHKVCGGR